MFERLPVLAAALWWGSLSAMGFLAVPLLFAHLPTQVLAGQTATHLLQAQTYVSMACCVVLFLVSKRKHAEAQEAWAEDAIVFVICGLLLALLVQYGVAPRVVARQSLPLWHTVGSVMYLLQWGCALAVLWRTARPALSPESS